MNNWIKQYIDYLKNLKQYSEDTILSYQKELQDFALFFKQSGLASYNEINYSIVRGYIVTLHDRHLSNVTIRHHISVLRSFFRYLLENEIVENNPFELVSLPKTEKRIPDFLYYDEFEMLVESIDTTNALGKRNRMIFELLYASGMRVGEVITIKLEDIDFDQGLIMVVGKGSKTRYVPFNPICQQYIVEYIEDSRLELMTKYQEEHHYLLVNQYGRSMTERGVYDIIQRVSKQSPLQKQVHPHMLRHTFATHLLDQGADIRIVQEMLGHANLASTQIYTHVTMDKLKKTYLNAHPMAQDKEKKY